MSRRLTSTAATALLLTLALCLTALPARAQEVIGPDTTPTAEPAPAPAPAVEAAPAAAPAETPTPETGPADAEGKKVGDGKTQDDKGTFPWQMIALLGVMFLLFFWMGRKPKKEQQRRQEMLANMKKGDKVTTIGGIIGTVLDIRDDEVVVKIDEASNTKMRFVKSAINRVGELKDVKKDEGEKK